LNMPSIAREEIFGILRDAYDGKSEKVFGNGIRRVYKSLFGILAGVTPIIEAFGSSSSMLGERFMKYRLPNTGHLKTGEAIIHAALKNITVEPRMRDELRKIAKETLSRKVREEDVPKLDRPMVNRITKLAQWVAVLRGSVSRERYTGIVQFKPAPEVGTRLAKQLAKLGFGISIFKREKKISESTYQILANVARGTAPDRVEEVVKNLYLKQFDEYADTKTVAQFCRLPQATVRSVLDDLEIMHVVQRNPTPKTNASEWRLSRTMLRMMRPLNLYRSEEAWLSAKRKK